MRKLLYRLKQSEMFAVYDAFNNNKEVISKCSDYDQVANFIKRTTNVSINSDQVKNFLNRCSINLHMKKKVGHPGGPLQVVFNRISKLEEEVKYLKEQLGVNSVQS